ncbi:MAG: hypothetical protein ACXQS8_04950, partial [Candidatus Helarchaeales archaeon]
LGFIFHCNQCSTRKIVRRYLPLEKEHCEACNRPFLAAGPLWTGKIFDAKWVEKMIEHLDELVLGTNRRIKKMLDIAREELKGPPTYHDLHALCDASELPIPKINAVIQELKNLGYFASRTSFSPISIRTTADRSILTSVIKDLVKKT